jgi:hypothetical protein
VPDAEGVIEILETAVAPSRFESAAGIRGGRRRRLGAEPAPDFEPAVADRARNGAGAASCPMIPAIFRTLSSAGGGVPRAWK